MKSARVQHSKYRNTGILFELLARQVTVDTLEERDRSPAVQIIKKFYNPTTEMGKELVLYRTLCESTSLTEARAYKLVDLVMQQRQRLNNKKLGQEKFKLIGEIKDHYPLKEFLSAKIPQYKLYASIYKVLLSEAIPNSIDVCDIQELSDSRFTIVESLTSTTHKKDDKSTSFIDDFAEQAEDLRLLGYKILVEKFNEKYSGLDENQRVLLRKYINNISNTNLLKEFMNYEVPRIKQELNAKIRQVDNKVTRIKLNEVVSQLDNVVKGKTVRDSQVSALMIAYQILKELE